MTLTLRWRPVPSRLKLRWRVGSSTTAIAQAGEGAAQLAAIIGPPGPAGDNAITRTAAEPIGGHRGVFVGSDNRARIADPALPGAMLTGVTVHAAQASGAAMIQTSGELTEGGWAWISGPVWLGAGGVLTQAPPTSGRLWRVGQAVGPTTILINPELIAQLGD